jgi:hypothetical protein
MINRYFYSEIGKLLYAVADTDGMISKTEKNELLNTVRKELLPAEKAVDKYGTDVALYAEIEFDILEDTMIDPEQAFRSFLNFVEEHHTAIDLKTRDVILNIAKRLSAAYRKTNRKEKVLLEKLEKKLLSISFKA